MTVYAVVYEDIRAGAFQEVHKIMADEAKAKYFVDYANRNKPLYINGTFKVVPFIVE